MRTWMRLALAALLATSFTLAPVRAGDAETNAEKIQRLEKELKQLRKDLDDLQDKLNVHALRRNSNSESVLKLQERLALLEQMVLRHDDLMKTPLTRQSAYGPDGQPIPPGGAANPTVATVRIRNQYPATLATVRLNGRTYTVEPNRTMTVTGVPVGSLTWDAAVEGYQLQPSTVTLTPRGYVINVYPLQP